MFKGKAIVNIGVSKIERRLNNSTMTAQQWLDERIVKDSNDFVPYAEGDLSSSPSRGTVFGSGKIVYNEPYARRQYYGETFNFSTDKHPKATHHWFEKAKSIYFGQWGRGIARILSGRWRGNR